MCRKWKPVSTLVVIGFSIAFFGMGCGNDGDSELNIITKNDDDGNGADTMRIGETLYTITIIDCFDSLLSAEGINNAGQIVGTSAGADINGYLYDQGECTSIQLGTYTFARGINDLEQIVGHLGTASCNDIGVGSESFLWDKTTNSLTTLEVPGSSNATDNVCGFSANSTYAYDINDQGQIVGQFNDASKVTHGFLYQGGNYIVIDVPDTVVMWGTNNTVAATSALGINNLGQIVGYFTDIWGNQCPFLYSEGKYENIDPQFTLWLGAVATDINDAGQIVGEAPEMNEAYTYRLGFLYSQGHFRQFDIPNSRDTIATGINNIGQIVGTFTEEGPNYFTPGVTKRYMLTPIY